MTEDDASSFLAWIQVIILVSPLLSAQPPAVDTLSTHPSLVYLLSPHFLVSSPIGVRFKEEAIDPHSASGCALAGHLNKGL